jgi:hypothetical protein
MLVTTPLGHKVLGCALRVHRRLGPGLFESVYQRCLAHELTRPYLRFSGLTQALLLNFNVARLKQGMKSFLNDGNWMRQTEEALEDVLEGTPPDRQS